MKGYECRKVENCIAKASVFLYTLDEQITEEWVVRLAQNGEFKVYKNFPRPSYTVGFSDGTKLIGALNETSVKVLFPLDNPVNTKADFELFLNSLREN